MYKIFSISPLRNQVE